MPNTNRNLLAATVAAVAIGIVAHAYYTHRELTDRGQIVGAKVLHVSSTSGAIELTYAYRVRGETYTRTSILRGRFGVQGDSVYVRYLPEAPAGRVRVYMSRDEINARFYN